MPWRTGKASDNKRMRYPVAANQGGRTMDADAKKTTLRRIPYGIYVLTADDGKWRDGRRDGELGDPERLQSAARGGGGEADSSVYAALKSAGGFALNMLGKDHKGLAFTFFKPAKIENGQLSGQSFTRGGNGAPRSSTRCLARWNARSSASWSKATTTSWWAR
jgi:flavin reductase (DIM6/NTAB) family NADH-FMN oxidoreductase RutF